MTSTARQPELERYAALLDEARAIKGVSLGQDAWRRLRRNRVAMVALGFLAVLSLLALLTPALPLQPPRYVNTDRQFAPPRFTVPEETGIQLDGDPLERRASLEEGFGRLDPASGAMLSLRMALFGEWAIPSICGTDSLGRDVLSRLFWGARISLAVGLVATLVSLLIGVAYGAIAGFFGGRIDNLMMRLVDVLYSIPFIFVVIFLITILSAETTRKTEHLRLPAAMQTMLEKGEVPPEMREAFAEAGHPLGEELTVTAEEPGVRWRIIQKEDRSYVVERGEKAAAGRLRVITERTGRVLGASRIVVFFFVIGAIYWLTMARVVRGQVISLRNEQFIEAARTIGAGRRRIIFLHLVPNLLSVVIVYLTLTIPRVMLFEAFLSFLGLGVEAPDVSWGLLANDGIKVITPVAIFWWLVVFPGLALGLTLWALNFLGDGLRDALDPRMKNR